VIKVRSAATVHVVQGGHGRGRDTVEITEDPILEDRGQDDRKSSDEEKDKIFLLW
jgi:hypothetical protein